MPPLMMGAVPLAHSISLKFRSVTIEAYQMKVRPDGNVHYIGAAPQTGKGISSIISLREYRIGQSGDPLICIGHTYSIEYKRGLERCVSHFLPTRALRESASEKPFVDSVERWPTDIALNAAVVSDDSESMFNSEGNKQRVADFVRSTYNGLPWETLSKVNCTRPAPNILGLRDRAAKKSRSVTFENSEPRVKLGTKKPEAKASVKPKPKPGRKVKAKVTIPTREILEEKNKAGLFEYCDAIGVSYLKRASKTTLINDIMNKFFPQSSEDKDCKKDSKDEEDDPDDYSDDDLGTARLQQLQRDKAERERRRRAANKAKIQQQIKKLEEETGETNLFPFTI